MAVTRERLEAETDVEFYRSGGPGGQHKNKTETAVRLKHRPTGITSQATEQRTRPQNLARAFERLAERVEIRETPKKIRKATKPTRASKRRRLGAKKHASEKKRDRRVLD